MAWLAKMLWLFWPYLGYFKSNVGGTKRKICLLSHFRSDFDGVKYKIDLALASYMAILEH